ncbi:TIGR02757 family protein [Maribacter cobaltidurans]|uniref:TIGR02757 family protein n=1 Tax=Maribacter cobaltidurans TaxID=1178778 RepID=A0A223VA84_9FLAO|nr:TIGR02757 family protein [Maribacter cobaltidurans]ASV32285.1 TIGR02757 family protein [Maribacter cobaltidurans]GGD94955.1 TIGR02757 family protein [Maribacter cobaltidurans]
MTKKELKEFLDQKVQEYNNPKFLESDPIQIPHLFSKKEDIEISAFLTATIAWGNRKSIINNANRMMELLGNSPHDFVMNHKGSDLELLQGFVHRTFNGTDLIYFIQSLKNIYNQHGGLQGVFTKYQTDSSLQPTISHFKGIFFELPFEQRTTKHVSDPLKGSAAKRINMFLRWMVRDANNQVDFGLWREIPPSKLSCPLDVHSGNVARKLKLLKRKQNDAKALAELDKNLRKLDPMDPVKYDFALFGLGVFEKF